MLNDADFSQFKHVYIFVGKTDLRKGIDGLATLVKQKFSLDPFQPGNLFLFCGSSNRSAWFTMYYLIASQIFSRCLAAVQSFVGKPGTFRTAKRILLRQIVKAVFFRRVAKLNRRNISGNAQQLQPTKQHLYRNHGPGQSFALGLHFESAAPDAAEPVNSLFHSPDTHLFRL